MYQLKDSGFYTWPDTVSYVSDVYCYETGCDYGEGCYCSGSGYCTVQDGYRDIEEIDSNYESCEYASGGSMDGYYCSVPGSYLSGCDEILNEAKTYASDTYANMTRNVSIGAMCV